MLKGKLKNSVGVWLCWNKKLNSFDDTKCVCDVYFENEYVGKSRYR